MTLEITKSIFDAALFISKNNKIVTENKKFSDYYYSSVDYVGGIELYKNLGREVFTEYNNEKNLEEKKKILRKIISKFFIKNKPNSLLYLPYGPIHFLERLSLNFNQIFEDADLLIAIESENEVSKDVMKWWDDLSQFSRSIMQDKKLESGRSGEEKTFNYEKKKLKNLKLNLKPKWEGFWDNKLGYDVQSWDKKSNKIYIEAKSSKQSNSEFFFSMNAWKCAVAEKDNYFVQVWIQDNSSPREMNYKELEGHVLKYEKISGKGDRWDTITIIPKGLN